MGALKGRFQCLRGLRVAINSPADHERACLWIKVAIVLHNLIIDVEGEVSAGEYQPCHTDVEEAEDSGGYGEDDESDYEEDSGEAKRQRLTAELLAYRAQRQVNPLFM